MATKKDSAEVFRLKAENIRLTNLLQLRTTERDEIKAQRDEIRKLYHEAQDNKADKARASAQQISLLETKLAAVAAVVAAVNAPTAPLNLWADRSGLAQRLPSHIIPTK